MIPTMTNAVEITCYIVVGFIMLIIFYGTCIKPFIKKKKDKKEDINNVDNED